MSKILNVEKTKITYEKPIEEIKKEFKENIIYSITHRTSKADVIGYIIACLFAGGILGSFLFGIASLIAWKDLSTNLTYVIISFAAGTIISFGVLLASHNSSKKTVNKLLALADTVSYDEFFEAYRAEIYNISLFPSLYLLELYCDYVIAGKVSGSIIKTVRSDTSLEISYAKENGDIETESIHIAKTIKNRNITEPELRVGNNLEITFVIPYVEKN